METDENKGKRCEIRLESFPPSSFHIGAIIILQSLNFFELYLKYLHYFLSNLAPMKEGYRKGYERNTHISRPSPLFSHHSTLHPSHTPSSLMISCLLWAGYLFSLSLFCLFPKPFLYHEPHFYHTFLTVIFSCVVCDLIWDVWFNDERIKARKGKDMCIISELCWIFTHQSLK